MDFMDMRESLNASGVLATKAIGQGFIGARLGATKDDPTRIAFMTTEPMGQHKDVQPTQSGVRHVE